VLSGTFDGQYHALGSSMSKPSWDQDSSGSREKRKSTVAKLDLLGSNNTLPSVIILYGVLGLVRGLQVTSRYPLCDHEILKGGFGATYLKD
jgi:hypothetical protein